MQTTYRINFINGAPFLDAVMRELEKMGHIIAEDNPDIIIGMSISQMDKIWQAHRKYPQAKLINYSWDIYSWALSNPRPNEYNYQSYIELLKESDEVLVPSMAEYRRTEKLLKPKEMYVIQTYVPYWDYSDIQDKRYVLNPIREQPDRDWGLLEECCKELNIPCVSSMHTLSFPDYQKTVAHCSFLVSTLHELSTGGLSLVEGYYLGKPCLISDSTENGGKDYLLNRATYFKDGDKEDLKKKLLEMWNNTPKVRADHKEWVEEYYSALRMAKLII